MAVSAETLALGKRAEQKVARFDIHQIAQHAGLMVSFTLLVITGLPMKFNNWGISQWWVGLWGGIGTLRAAHHFAAYLIVLVSLYHIGYLVYTILVLKRPFPIKMIPAYDDFVKLYQEIFYFIGLRKEKPENDRFNWKEKFDYWAIFWGMPVMVLSGFVMMYPVFVSRFLPGWIVPAALIAHSDEAMLALTWIFMVHVFFNHFSPGIFPINTSIFTGKVPRDRYERDHSLEYQRILDKENKPSVG